MRRLRCLVALFSAICAATTLRADVLPYSGAEVADNIALVRIENDGVHLQLEVIPENFSAIFGISSEQSAFESTGAASLLPDASQVALSGLSIATEDESILEPKILLIDRRERINRASPLAGRTDPITGMVIPSPPDDPSVIYVEAFFDFNGSRPDRLVISQTQPDDAPPLELGFMVFDRAVPVTRFSFLDRAHLDVDWADPWHTAFTNPNLNRQARHGTTSYLYVAPREIRHEVLMRLPDLAPWIERPLPSGSTLDAATQAEILKEALDVLAVRNALAIEGEALSPSSTRGTFLSLGERGFQIEEGSRSLVSDTAFVGTVLSYPVANLPSQASITWDMFDENILEVPMTLTDEAGPFLDWATPEQPQVTWTNHLKQYVDPQVAPVPLAGLVTIPAITLSALVVAAGLVAASLFVALWPVRLALLSIAGICVFSGYATRNAFSVHLVSPFESRSGGELVEQALAKLLSQIYVAALEVTPSDRAAALAQITTEAGNVELANELESNLAIRVPGGGLAKVTEIDEVSVEGKGLPVVGPYQGLAHWRIDARAAHWGHDHRRRVEYRAHVTMIPEGGQWKLVALTVLEANSPDA